MSIASEITRINTNIAAAYTACSDKGATMPQTQNSANLADTIDSIPSGGGTLEESDVNFYDYDGTLLYSYTKAEASALSALPALPTRDGLTAQNWTHTLQQIREAPDGVDVGCNYETNDGSTKLYLFADAGASFESFPVYLIVAPETTLTVNWGDGTSSEITNSDLLPQNISVSHTYAARESDTVFCIRILGGSFEIGRSPQVIYKPLALERIHLGSNCTAIRDNAFRFCYGLKSISIPNSVISIGPYAFYNCYRLKFVSIPNSVASLGNYAFNNCNNLTIISIPSRLTSIGLQMFSYCYAIERAILPDSIITVSNQIFYSCKNLRKLRLSDAIYSISSEMFRDCSLLSSVTVPAGVNSIGSDAFYNCEHLMTVDLSAFTDPSHIPTLQSDAVSSVFFNSPAVIYVANAEMLSVFSAATNWSSLPSSRLCIKGA